MNLEAWIRESNYVIAPSKTYENEDVSKPLTGLYIDVSSCEMVKIENPDNKDMYTLSKGKLKCTGDISLDANIIKACVERRLNGEFIFSGYLGDGTIGLSVFPSGSVSMTGTCSSITTGKFTATNGYIYFTENATEYAKRSVEWDLFEYGQNCLRKLAYPSYSFSVDSANFLALKDFVAFKDYLTLGRRIYLNINNDSVLEPILVKVEISFEDFSSASFEFSDRFSASDGKFYMDDLLIQSVTMGKKLDFNKYNYGSFVSSGASTTVDKFMKSALDVSKNAVLSSKNQAISWDESGLFLRQWNANKTKYLDEQIAMINNNIVFTDDNWASAKMAIGKFEDDSLGSCWGVVAPNIVGTLLAGKNLVIESAKKDGGFAVFKVDSEGAFLHNAQFTLLAWNGRITLDPKYGMLGGASATMFLNDGVWTNKGLSVTRISQLASGDTPNPCFWLDMNGELYLRGTRLCG